MDDISLHYWCYYRWLCMVEDSKEPEIVMPQDESWSWIKFLKGPVIGKNYAKSIVNLICTLIIITICYSVYTVIKSRFSKPASTQEIGTNTGVVVTSNEDKHGNSFSLFNLFNSR